MSELHVSWYRVDGRKRMIRHCPTCNRRRRMVAEFQHWYGWTTWCLGCGDCWRDGELAERPFRRGWRKEARDNARKRWDQGPVPLRMEEATLEAVPLEDDVP